MFSMPSFGRADAPKPKLSEDAAKDTSKDEEIAAKAEEIAALKAQLNSIECRDGEIMVKDPGPVQGIKQVEMSPAQKAALGGGGSGAATSATKAASSTFAASPAPSFGSLRRGRRRLELGGRRRLCWWRFPR